jgi:hypothetical protein
LAKSHCQSKKTTQKSLSHLPANPISSYKKPSSKSVCKNLAIEYLYTLGKVVFMVKFYVIVEFFNSIAV